jgi:Tol biopolymer transport system component
LDAFEVAVVSLATEAQQTLVRGTDGAVTASGHLVFGREASLWAVPFDPDRLTVSGEPAPMVEGVQVNTGGWAQYALADDGTLVYLPAFAGGAEFVWVDRMTGEETPLAAPPRSYAYPRISPDGTRVAVDRFDQQEDIWVWDLTGETLTRLTFDAAREQYPTWTPDSQRVIFSSGRAGAPGLFWRAADGMGTAEPLGESERPRLPQAVAPDGSVVVVVEGTSSANLITVSLTGDPVSKDLLVTEFNERNAVLSPDGQWVAYQSDASGTFEVYVQPFPDADEEFNFPIVNLHEQIHNHRTAGSKSLWDRGLQ